MAIWLGELKLDCRRCSPQERVDNGCQRDSPILGVWKIGKWEFNRCPKKIVTSKSFECIRAFNFYKEGFFPNPGGWMDQPVKFIEIIEYIQKAIDECDERNQDAE